MSSRIEGGTGTWTAAVAAVLAIAAALRLPGLDAQLWYDEIATLVVSVREPVSTIVTAFPGVNQHPLFSLLSHLSVAAFGETPWAIRLPAAVFGVVAVWTVWDAGRLVLSRAEALTATVLLATSYHHVWFSQNARGYTLLATFTLLSTSVLLRLADRDDPKLYAAYVVTAVAGVYTHLTMAFVLIAHVLTVGGAWLLGSETARRYAPGRLITMWAVVVALVAVTYAPYVPELLVTFTQQAPPQAARVATASRAAGDLVHGVTEGFGLAGLLVAVVSASVGGLRLLRSQPFVVFLLIMPAVTTVGLTALMGQPIRPRFVFNLSGAAALFVAAGAGVLARIAAARLAPRASWAPAAALALLLLTLAPGASSALARNAVVPKQDFTRPLAYLDAAAARGDAVFGAGAVCLPLQQYFQRRWPCVETIEEWRAELASHPRALVVHTLLEFWHDVAVIEAVARECRDVQRAPGTLGGGDVVVCAISAAAP